MCYSPIFIGNNLFLLQKFCSFALELKGLRVTARGCPLVLFAKIMITAQALGNTIANYLNDNGLFLVDIEITKDNDITVSIESRESDVKIDNCIDIDRIIAAEFDRDVEDYSLTVTSAGLDQPFKVLDQYRKFAGTEVEVVIKGGGKVKGILSAVNEESFEITTSKMVKVEGSKKKVQQDTVTAYSYDGIKSCKPVIKFK